MCASGFIYACELFELKHRRSVWHLGLGRILSATEAHSRHVAAVQWLKIPIYNNFGNPTCSLICETKYSIILLRCKISLHIDITLAEWGAYWITKQEIHSVDLDKHLLSRHLGAVIKYRLVLRLPAEAVLQRIKRAWVLNQWFAPIAEINGRGWVVSKSWAAMEEHRSPRAKADPRHTAWESPFHGLLCFLRVKHLGDQHAQHYHFSDRKEGKQSSTAAPVLPFYLACLIIWVWKAWAPRWGDVHLLSVYSAVLDFCMGDHQQPDLMLGSAKPP